MVRYPSDVWGMSVGMSRGQEGGRAGEEKRKGRGEEKEKRVKQKLTEFCLISAIGVSVIS